ncbi:UvrD-helicase domain-containing protein [Kribbella lupini]|uniref:UvrD-helicase domain-containing protein n=1 Tax=Kribbella lupini TaxID=291602 RepID=A0ABN2B136_9ACTN
MSRRADQPDTPADLAVRRILRERKVPAFTMIAGAGSGKTTSLIKALDHVIASRGSEMLAQRQQVACITYTEIARQEIEDELAGNPIVHVSTIHSFLWTIVEPFGEDIRQWLGEHGALDVDQAEAKYAAMGPQTRQKTKQDLRDKIDRKRDQLSKLPAVEEFRLGVGTNYARGIVGYADIVKLGPDLILRRSLLARLVSRRYPVLFVDESQDTFDAVVDCLRHVAVEESDAFCLGFFGDPMQMIYTNGTGEIPVEPDWEEIPKPENFRSPLKVLDVINVIRGDHDILHQRSGLPVDKQRAGEVTYFVFPQGVGRNELLGQTRKWLREQSEIDAWKADDGTDQSKTLVITHRMAAGRLGFEALYDTFHGTVLAADFTEGKAWPLTPFLGTLLPLVEAAGSNRNALLPMLRTSSPLLRPGNIDAVSAQETLATLRAGVDELVKVVAVAGPGSIKDALAAAHNHSLIELDDRLIALLGDDLPEPMGSIDKALRAYLDCDVTELEGYSRYISQESPYSTQHGVKGAEYQDVIVVLDDDEGTHNQYSYEKFFGLRSFSSGDGTVTRTRRLLYVCASRATRALAIVFYATDVDAAIKALGGLGLPGAESVVTAEMVTRELDDGAET